MAVFPRTLELGLWQKTLERLQQATVRWQIVKGPMAALIATLLDIGWQPLQLDLWLMPDGTELAVDYDDGLAAALVWEKVEETLDRHHWQLVANSTPFKGVEHGLDFTVPKRLIKQFRSANQSRRSTAFRLVLQGHMYKVAKLYTTCPLCGLPMHETHWLWDCVELNKLLPEPWPAEWEPLCRHRSQQNCFWQCGLVPFRLTNNLGTFELDLEVEGVFAQPWPTDNPPTLHFGGDASGEPHSADPRKRKIAFAVAAVCFDALANEWKVAGKLTANLVDKAQTVPRGEAFALLFCLKATRHPFKFVTDAQYVFNRARKVRNASVSTFSHPDVWSEVQTLSAQRSERLELYKIKSHLTQEQWLLNNPENELRQWIANHEADKLCTVRADSLIDPAAVVMQNWVDARINRALNHHIEVALALQADHRYVRAKQKQCNQGKSRMTKQDCFDVALAGRHGNLHEGMHVWARKGQGLERRNCAWAVRAQYPARRMQYLFETPCLAADVDMFRGAWNIHSSHVLRLIGRHWECSGCGRKGPLNRSRKWSHLAGGEVFYCIADLW